MNSGSDPGQVKHEFPALTRAPVEIGVPVTHLNTVVFCCLGEKQIIINKKEKKKTRNEKLREAKVEIVVI